MHRMVHHPVAKRRRRDQPGTSGRAPRTRRSRPAATSPPARSSRSTARTSVSRLARNAAGPGRRRLPNAASSAFRQPPINRPVSSSACRVLVAALVQVPEVLGQPAQEPQLLDAQARRRQVPAPCASVESPRPDAPACRGPSPAAGTQAGISDAAGTSPPSVPATARNRYYRTHARPHARRLRVLAQACINAIPTGEVQHVRGRQSSTPTLPPTTLGGRVKSGHLWTPQIRPFPASRDGT